MNFFRLFFPAVFFILTLSAFAQQGLSTNKENVLQEDKTRPNIEQTMNIIAEGRAQGKSPAQISRMLNQIIPIPGGGTGIISGLLFESDGKTPLSTSSQVLVYDAYGFFEGSTYINAADTVYAVGNLAPGMHYVLAYSYEKYLNAFYPDKESWHKATMVQTFNDSTVSDINFHLEVGKVITGKVLKANSLDPLAGAYAYFYLYDDNALLETDNIKSFYSAIEANGRYALNGIRPGKYKLRIFNEQYLQSYYSEQKDLATADIIEVSAETDSVKFINFVLNPAVGVQDGYEANNVYTYAYELSIGEIVKPQINPAADYDYFTFTAQQGDTLAVTVEAQALESLLYPYVLLYDSSATYAIISWSGGDINGQNLIMPYSGRYYIRVGNQNNLQGGEDYYYTLSVHYDTPASQPSAYISGYVFEENESTPYSGPGYYIQLYKKDGSYYNNILSVDSVYVFGKIPAGVYTLAIYAPEQDYLMEWYENAATLYQATEIKIADKDSITDINFVLDRSGTVSGRIFMENYLNDFTYGGYITLFSDEEPYYNPGFNIASDEEGVFMLSGVQPGQYTLRFDPNDYESSYPAVWYGDVGSRGQSTPITVNAADTTDNITLIVKRGGIVQGFITMDNNPMEAVSSDSLLVTINPYDEAGFYAGAQSRSLIRETFAKPDDTIIGNNQTKNTFNGGYRSSLLYPGSYKLQVLPQMSGLSSWYYSSGSHFDDAGSQLIEIKSDSVHEVPVKLKEVLGAISGIIYRADGSTPSTRPGMVYAYDPSGHMVQSTQIGLDPQTGQLLADGHYKISGLTDGHYYVMLYLNSNRTDLRAQMERVPAGNNINEFIPIIAIQPSFNKQHWYPDAIIETPALEQMYFLPIPDAAQAVTVSGSSVTDGINFTHMLNAVTDKEKTKIADNFEISAVYPNPFNPLTTIAYKVPLKSRVKIEVFNILGQKVTTLFDNIHTPGTYKIKWNGKNSFEQQVSSGIYIVHLQAGAFQSSRKMLLLR